MKSGCLIILALLMLAQAALAQSCVPKGNQTSFGTSNTWIGYVYEGMNFNAYQGFVSAGSSQSPNFQANFSSDSAIANFSTNSCRVLDEQFSIRYLLSETLPEGNYTFTVGAPGGFRLSIDGGNSWVINNWNEQPYTTNSYSIALSSGNYDLVLEYYQASTSGSLSFSMSTYAIEQMTMAFFKGQMEQDGAVLLDWSTIMETNNNYFVVQRSADGVNYQQLAEIPTQHSDTTTAYSLQYAYVDPSPLPGNSYYRLEMVDKFGLKNYSKIIAVNNNNLQGVKIYPTVVTNSSMFVETDKPIKNARAELFDLSGKKINETDWADLSGRQSFNIAGNRRLVTGNYVLLLTSEGNNLLHQIIVVQSN